ncbi:MAG: copper oxidase [Halioglobus sp.]|nr:copper oxidase [Halioglobus sp.]
MRHALLLSLLIFSTVARAAVVEYHLAITERSLALAGAPATAMLVNDAYPGPVLRFRQGDTARISVTNHTDKDTSVHWHGLLVPPGQDGVPYLSYLPIRPGETFVYEFPLKHAGTYWYHSHTDLQEQSGVHGGIVVQPLRETVSYDREAVLVLQDWTNETPRQVLANLKKDGDYYALKKHSVTSIAGYLQRGAMGTWLENRWNRMGGMDVADVGYDAFFINGRRSWHLFPEARPGERIRLRFINAGASTYFLLHSAGLPFEVIGADGLAVEPVQVDEVLHAVAETYDIVVTVPPVGALELRASAQDGSGHASVFIGSGERRAAPDMPRPDLYAAHGQHDAHAGGHAHHHAMHHTPRRLDYRSLRNVDDQAYAGQGPPREVLLRLTGDMETYNWTFNNVPLSRADKILVKRGETVRFRFVNETMMHHPLHLHGHFFRVLNDDGGGPFKHTVDVGPMQTVSIEFLANEEKDWFFHCHNLYHAKTGMARVIRYDDYAGNREFDTARQRSSDIKDDDFYAAGELKALDDFARLSLWTANNRYRFEGELESRDYEQERGEANALYRLDRWTQLLAGVEKEEDESAEGRLGLRYVLPLLIETEVFVTTDGEIEAEFETELQLATRLQLHAEYETTERYHVGLEYRLDEHLSLEGAYTSDVDVSLGVKLRF